MGSLSIWHWAIVVLALVLLFGSRRLPDATRNLGRSLRILKSEVKEMQQDGTGAGTTAAQQTYQPPAPAPLPQAQQPGVAPGWQSVPQQGPAQPVDAAQPQPHVPPQAV
jgi:sec-independent protein translocase protein TatA